MIDHKAAGAPLLNLIAAPAARAALNGISAIDFRSTFALAAAAGRGMPSMLRNVVALRFGPGRLTLNEYYYYWLWEPGIDEPFRQHLTRHGYKHAKG